MAYRLKYHLHVLLLLMLCSMHRAAAQDTGETVIPLNGKWAFKTDPDNTGESRQWFNNAVARVAWDSLEVPGNWDTKNEYSHYAGKAFYNTSVNIPATLKGKTVRLFFEAVYNESRVWLNGKLLGDNNSGFLPFEFDVSSLLKYGAINEITVMADNTFRLGATWNWGGIRRPVKLIIDGPVRIVQQHIASDVNLANGTATITVTARLVNTGEGPRPVNGVVEISNTDGVRKTAELSGDLAPGQQKDMVIHISLAKKETHLWNLDDPYLYNSKITVRANGKVEHVASARFGLRKIEVRNSDYTLRLNGQSIRPVGFNLVCEDRTNGNTLPLWRMMEDIDLMKSLGVNMARMSHHPFPQELLDYLDEKGIMVFEEIPVWGSSAMVAKDSRKPASWLGRMISGHFNHPSVIGWCVGNEIGQNPGVMDYVKSAIEYVKSLDTTRLAVMVSHTALNKIDPIEFSDLGLVNRYGARLGSAIDIIHAQHPDKVLFCSEYGLAQSREDLDADIDASSMLDSIRNKPFLIGASLWTFNDYRSNYYKTTGFSENRAWGVVDVFRQKKTAYFSYQREYAPIASFRLDKTGEQAISFNALLTPRKQYDIPANTLTGYRLVWKALDENGKLTDGGFRVLPVIHPGDPLLSIPIGIGHANLAGKMIVELVSPLNYVVRDTTIFFSRPTPPNILYATGMRTLINEVPQHTGGIRVVFQKNKTATSYRLRYTYGGKTGEIPITHNHYADIPGLDQGDKVQISLAGINNAGESAAGAPREVEVAFDPAPPIITYTEPADKGFFAGYATDEYDYAFTVQYTTRKGDYTHAPCIQSTNKGVLFVPGLQNGTTYYYRMKRALQNSYESPWSEEIAVMPDGSQPPPHPLVPGVIRNGKDAIICFEPVKKCTGYILQVKPAGSGEWTSFAINAAQVNQYMISDLRKDAAYEFRMAAINAYGQSGYSETINVLIK